MDIPSRKAITPREKMSKTIINETGFYVRSIGYEDVAYNNL